MPRRTCESESQDISGNAGVTSTGDAAFVNFQDTEYEIPAEIFTQFTSTYEQLQRQADQQADEEEGANLLSSIGIDPTNWLTDTENEGNEDVDGTETIHISGQADVPKLVEDLKTISQSLPQGAQQANPADLEPARHPDRPDRERRLRHLHGRRRRHPAQARGRDDAEAPGGRGVSRQRRT